MKACIFTVVVSIVLTSFAVSQTLFQSKIDSANQTNSTVNTYFPVIIDPGMTMRIGAENTVSILNGLAAAEDHFIKTKWFAEHSVAGKTGGIAGRLAKYALIDLPADYFSVGTGARIFRTRCAISRARYEQHLLCVRHAPALRQWRR